MTASFEDLETPVPLVDLDVMERNLDRMARYASGHGIELRPHIKTHKSPRVAAEQLRRGAVGFVLEKMGRPLQENPRPIAWALIVGGVAFLLVERWLRDKPLRDEVTWTVAIAVGVGQLIAAIFPGTSRSGSTILFSLMLGLGRPAATEFSFLVGIPTMLAAGGLKIFKALHHVQDAAIAASAPPEDWGMVILGTIVAAAVSFAAVKWFLRYVQTHTFEGFGWYRVVLGILILIFIR